jgi:hypothetical protein
LRRNIARLRGVSRAATPPARAMFLHKRDHAAGDGGVVASGQRMRRPPAAR